MGVDVGVSDLVRSYATLRDSAGTSDDPAARLLLFYSVECGLKAAYLGKNGTNGRSTAALPQHLRNHNLRALAKELRIGPMGDRLPDCRRRHDSQCKVTHHELHQAWRYGATLHEEDEKVADAALRQLSDWCRREHKR